jgi:hypothetical protein
MGKKVGWQKAQVFICQADSVEKVASFIGLDPYTLRVPGNARAKLYRE